jgi:hypothetical protein
VITELNAARVQGGMLIRRSKRPIACFTTEESKMGTLSRHDLSHEQNAQ